MPTLTSSTTSHGVSPLFPSESFRVANNRRHSRNCSIITFRRSSRRNRFLLHHPWYGDEFIAFALVAGDQPIRGDHGLGAVRAHLFVSAVVQQDHVAAANLFDDLALDCRGGRRIPVVAGYVPHDRLQAKFAGDAQHGGAASAEGRAEEI